MLCDISTAHELEGAIDDHVELKVQVALTVQDLLRLEPNQTALLNDHADGLQAELLQQDVLLVQLSQGEQNGRHAVEMVLHLPVNGAMGTG